MATKEAAKTKHTQGTLTAHGGTERAYIATADRHIIIADCGAGALPNAEHLAACWNACEGINPEAVPDLLAALEMAYAQLVEDADYLPVNSQADANCAEIMRIVCAALAKARGTE